MLLLDDAIRRFTRKAFVRLGSRSPKDTRSQWGGRPIPSGAAAIDLLCYGSERVADDLELAIANRYDPFLFVRPWIEIPPWGEVRSFVSRKQLVGISQYYTTYHGPEIERDRERTETAVRALMAGVIGAAHLEDFVADVCLDADEGRWRLMDLNPFFPRTDACLFDWTGGGFDGVFRFRDAEGRICTSGLPAASLG